MLRADGLSVTIKKKEILKNISFEIKPNSFTVLMGKNGSGKSTLVSCINQMRAYEGELLFEEQSLKKMSPRQRAANISILPQMLASPHILVEDLVKMGRNPFLDVGGRFTPEDEAAVDKGFSIMGIGELRHRFVDELSGGERQKAYMAMILAQDTELIVLDEPTTYMDVEYQAEFMRILKHIKEECHKTLLVVMHDLNMAAEYADDILVLDKGSLCFAGTKKECLRERVIEQIFHVKGHVVEEKNIFII